MMSKHTVRIIRSPLGILSSNSLGTDALNGISSIPGVSSAEITEESGAEVTLAFEWDGREAFQSTDVHLAKFHVQRVWEK